MSKKILVVDDEPDILRVVLFRLKQLGHDVITAVNGQEALEMARKEKPDVILLDVCLPVIDGYQVCRQLKGDEQLKGIPVIFLTASNVVEIAHAAEELGAENFLIKPFEPEELLAKVRKYLE